MPCFLNCFGGTKEINITENANTNNKKNDGELNNKKNKSSMKKKKKNSRKKSNSTYANGAFVDETNTKPKIDNEVFRKILVSVNEEKIKNFGWLD